MGTAEMPKVTTVELEKARFALYQRISPFFLPGSTSVEVEPDFMTNMIQARVSGELLTERIGTKSVSFPADWLQAVKERWAPAWAKRRWPVRWTVFAVDIQAVYTDFKPSIPGEKFIRWATPRVDGIP